MTQPAVEPSRSAMRGTGLRPWRKALRALDYFRQSRPLIGAIILALGGYFIMQPVLGASFQAIVQLGMRGASAYLLGGAMILAAIIATVAPAQRHFPAVIAVVCAVLSLPFANLGGLFIGMVLGILGGGMVFAWTPYTDQQLARFQQREIRRQQRRDERALQRTGHRQRGH